jgi:sarcosine oxidase gamma subunit
MRPRSLAMVSLAVAVVCAACDSNKAGNIAATTRGDLSHALGERTPAMAGRWTGCFADTAPGADAAQGPSPLARRPYLQELTDRSLQVVWTAEGPMADVRVLVTHPDGTPAAAAAAARDASARPPQGASQWTASVVGLEPDTAYCYQLRSGTAALARGTFRTAPAAGSDQAVRFVAFGDSGNGGSDQRAVLQQLGTVPFDLMLHLGDIAYESGTRVQLESYFFDVYADLLENFAVFPASGNHEYGSDDAAPFREAFVLPENGGPEGRERWYSYDWGDVHFVALDTERVGPVQARWLDDDLTATRQPWTIVYQHRPAFSSGEHGSDAAVQQQLVPVFVRHHVPLVLAGHDHDYERTVPLDGVTYVVSGGGGRGTRQVGRSPFTAFSEAVCHFIYVTVTRDELTVHAIDGTGQEFDSLQIRR